MAVKTITVRLPQTTYEKLCQLAEISEELPSEMARNILREFVANLEGTKESSLAFLFPGKTKGTSELEVRLETSEFKDLPEEEQNRLRQKYGLPLEVRGRLRQRIVQGRVKD